MPNIAHGRFFLFYCKSFKFAFFQSLGSQANLKSRSRAFQNCNSLVCSYKSLQTPVCQRWHGGVDISLVKRLCVCLCLRAWTVAECVGDFTHNRLDQLMTKRPHDTPNHQSTAKRAKGSQSQCSPGPRRFHACAHLASARTHTYSVSAWNHNVLQALQMVAPPMTPMRTSNASAPTAPTAPTVPLLSPMSLMQFGYLASKLPLLLP
jgi:hypothetical protein